MPVNQYGNEDLSAFFHGAQVGNMLVQQRERAQELASENALRAVQERHLAAQAEQIAYNVQQRKDFEAKLQDTADTMDRIAKQHTETTFLPPGEDPAPLAQQGEQMAEAWAARNRPEEFAVIAKAKQYTQKNQLEMAKIASRENIAQGHDAAKLGAANIGATSREKIASTRAPNGYAPSVTEKDALALQKADDSVDQAYADGDAEGITRAEKFRDNLNAGFERQHPDQVRLEGVKALRTELGVVLKEYWSGGRDEKLVPKINALKDQIKAVTTKASDTSAPAASAPAPSTPKRFKLDINSGKLVPIQ